MRSYIWLWMLCLKILEAANLDMSKSRDANEHLLPEAGHDGKLNQARWERKQRESEVNLYIRFSLLYIEIHGACTYSPG